MLPENRIVLQDNALDATPSLRVAPWLADEFIEVYLCWREESVAVESAYERWRVVRPGDRALAFAAYRAALDREEHATRVFRDAVERIFGPSA
jgi:hypothetical protein